MQNDEKDLARPRPTVVRSDEQVPRHAEGPSAATAPERATHTPGPWTFDSHPDYPLHYIHALEAFTPMVARTCFAPASEANARLIAAAPMLFDSLRLMLDRYVATVNSGDCGNWNPEEEQCVIFARAAIAKAEGK